MNTARPVITAMIIIAIVTTSRTPSAATAPATSARMPSGASSRTQRTITINA